MTPEALHVVEEVADYFEAQEGINPVWFTEQFLRHYQFGADITTLAFDEAPIYTDTDYSDLMYWAGFFFSYWMFEKDLSGEKILQTYDIQDILNGYPALHMFSIKKAIRDVEENSSWIAIAIQDAKEAVSDT